MGASRKRRDRKPTSRIGRSSFFSPFSRVYLSRTLSSPLTRTAKPALEVLEERTLLAGNTISDTGGYEGSNRTLELGANGGVTLEYYYEHYGIPDNFIIRYEGKNLLETGFVGGSKTGTLEVPQGNSDTVQIVVATDDEGTAWQYEVTAEICPDTGNFNIELASGEFTRVTGEDDRILCTAEGTVFIGRTDGIQQMIRVDNATIEHDKESMKISGTVYSLIGAGDVLSRELFTGSFEVPFHTGTSTSFSETGDGEYQVGGMEIEFSKITFTQRSVALGAKFELIEEFGFPEYVFSGPDGLIITQNDVRFGPSVKFSSPNFKDINLFGLLPIKEFSDFSIEYIGAEDTIKIQGKLGIDLASKPLAGEVVANLAGENFIQIKGGEIDLRGQLKVTSDLKFPPGGWGLKEVTLDADTIAGEVTGTAKLVLPFGKGIDTAGTIGFRIAPLELNTLGLEVTGLNLPVPQFPGVFFQGLQGSVDNLAGSAPDPIQFGGGIFASLGPKFFGVSAIDVNVNGTVDEDSFTGSGKVTLIDETILQINGSATLNWDKKTFEANGSLSLIDGLIQTSASFKPNSNFDVSMYGTTTINVPESVPMWGGAQIASGNYVVDFTNDGDLSNDFVAGWGTLNVQKLGTEFNFVVGFKAYFDGRIEPIGSKTIPPVGSWYISPSTDWVLISTEWENPTGGAVPLRVERPDGTFIEETDFEANGIAIVDQFSTSTRKVVLISNPIEGIWDVNVVDPTGLGTVIYDAVQEGFAPTIEITTPGTTVPGGLVDIVYSAFDADSDAEVQFFYDTDDTGFDGVPLPDRQLEMDGVGTYQWDTAGLAPGDYYLYAMVTDGDNPPVLAYAPGLVQVTEGADLSATIRVTPDSLHVRDEALFQFSIDNEGPSAARDVLATASLAGHLESSTVGLDSTFASNGIYRASSVNVGELNTIAIDANDRTIVAEAMIYADPDGLGVKLHRLSEDGVIDTSFGDEGTVFIPFNAVNVYVDALAIDHKGRILFAATVYNENYNGNYDGEVVIARLTPTGALDTTFDEDGVANFQFGERSSAEQITIASDGDLYFAALTYDEFHNDHTYIAKLNEDGSLDTGFGNQGILTVDVGTNSVYLSGLAIDSHDRIVVVGDASDSSNYYPLALARFDEEGRLDTTFGDAGVALMDYEEIGGFPIDLAIDSSNRIVIGGMYRNYGEMGVVRFADNGVLDTTFGSAGFASVSVDFITESRASSLAIGPEDEIVLTGIGYDWDYDDEFLITARFGDSGIPDETFGTAGVNVFSEANHYIYGAGVAIDSVGRVVVGGNFVAGSGRRDIVVRYAPAVVTDIYELSLTAGDTVVIETTTPHEDLDPALELIGPGGLTLVSDQNGGDDGRNARIEFTATETGMFQVLVSSEEFSSGDYHLLVSFATDLLPSGGTRVFEIGMQAPVEAGTIESRLEVTSSTYDPLASNDFDSLIADVETHPLPDLRVSVSSVDTVSIGQTFSYEIQITNDGAGPAHNVIVSEFLSGSYYVDAQVSQGYFDYFDSLGTVVANLGTIEPGGHQVIQITVTPFVAGSLYTSTIVTSDEEDSAILNNFLASVISVEPQNTLQPADLEVTVRVDNTTPAVSDSLAIEVQVTNTGPGIGSGIEVANLIPPNLSITGFWAEQGTFDPQTGVWLIGNMRDNLTRTLVINTTVVDNRPFVVSAEITHANEPDPDSVPGNGVRTEDDYAFVEVGTVHVSVRLTDVFSAASAGTSEFDDGSPSIFHEWQNVVAEVWLTIGGDLPDDVLDLAFTLGSSASLFNLPTLGDHLGTSASVNPVAGTEAHRVEVTLNNVDLSAYELGDTVLVAALSYDSNEENTTGISVAQSGVYPQLSSENGFFIESVTANDSVELNAAPQVSGEIAPVIYDSNDDGKVSLADFVNFLGEFGKEVSQANPGAYLFDYDRSGRVSLADFVSFVTYFGTTKSVDHSINMKGLTVMLTTPSSPGVLYDNEPVVEEAIKETTGPSLPQSLIASTASQQSVAPSEPFIELPVNSINRFTQRIRIDSGEVTLSVPLNDAFASARALEPRLIDALFRDDAWVADVDSPDPDSIPEWDELMVLLDAAENEGVESV